MTENNGYKSSAQHDSSLNLKERCLGTLLTCNRTALIQFHSHLSGITGDMDMSTVFNAASHTLDDMVQR